MTDSIDPVLTRPMTGRDRGPAAALLDSAVGRGYWSLDPGNDGSHRVAERDGALAGVASGCLADRIDEAPGLAPPVGLVRLVAVEPSCRRLGIATRLVREVIDDCLRLGAADLASYAWVHGRTGTAPLAGVLERLGFRKVRRIEHFYAGGGDGGPCPGCGHSPCDCPADLYVRRG